MYFANYEAHNFLTKWLSWQPRSCDLTISINTNNLHTKLIEDALETVGFI